jgi:hypothetical protein
MSPSSTSQAETSTTIIAPAATLPQHVNEPLDLQDSSVEDLLRFLRRQPTKYYVSFVAGALALLSAVAGATWLLANSKAELAAAIRVGDLKLQIASLRAELSGASQIAAYQREELHAQSAEYQSAQQIIQTLQEAIADKDHRLVAAQGCESIRADFRQAINRAGVVSRKLETAEGLEKKKLEAEDNFLEAKVQLLKGSFDACAAR